MRCEVESESRSGRGAGSGKQAQAPGTVLPGTTLPVGYRRQALPASRRRTQPGCHSGKVGEKARRPRMIWLQRLAFAIDFAFLAWALMNARRGE